MRCLIPLALLLALPASADLAMSYNGFYGRMKKLQQPEYSDITLAFALLGERSAGPCRFYRMQLSSDRHDITLNTAANGEISLPYDEALKDSNAVLRVYQADNAEPCQVQFRLRSRMRLPAAFDQMQLQHYRSQFERVLDDMAGLGKYWLPDVIGVIAQFADDRVTAELNPAAQSLTRCQAERCEIRLNDKAAEGAQWAFSQRPLYVLPLIAERTP